MGKSIDPRLPALLFLVLSSDEDHHLQAQLGGLVNSLHPYTFDLVHLIDALRFHAFKRRQPQYDCEVSSGIGLRSHCIERVRFFALLPFDMDSTDIFTEYAQVESLPFH